MPERDILLLFAPTPTQFREMLRVAHLAKESGRYRPIILGEMPDFLLEQVRPLAVEKDIELFDYNSPETWPVEDRTPLPLGRMDWRVSMEVARERFRTVLDWDSAENYFKLVRHGLSLAKAALKRFRPVAIVIPEQTVGHQYMTLVRMVRPLGLPVVVVPFTISSEKEAAVAFVRHESFETLFSTRPTFNRYVARFLPQWVYEHEGQQVLRWPPGGALASWWYATASPRPWIYNDGHATAIAAENEHMADLYRKSGIDPAKIRVTGCVADDVRQSLLDRRDDARREFTAEVGLELGDRKLVVAAIPPELEGVPSCVGGFADLAREVASVGVHHPDVVTLLSLHPTIKRERVAELEKLPGTRISTRSVAELIPVADLYLACASATIRQAIAAGVPVVNFDAFAFAYDDYVGIPGVFTVATAPDLWRTMGGLLGDDAALAKAKAEIGKESKRWGVRGGVAGKQILGLVEELRVNYPRPLDAVAVDDLGMRREGNEHLQPLVNLLLSVLDVAIVAGRVLQQVPGYVSAAFAHVRDAALNQWRRAEAMVASLRLRGLRGFVVHLWAVCDHKRMLYSQSNTPRARLIVAVLALASSAFHVPHRAKRLCTRIADSVRLRGPMGFLRHVCGARPSEAETNALRR